MSYTPEPYQGEDLESYISRELQKISAAMQSTTLAYFIMKEMHAAPPKVKDNLIVLADGVDWDPGDGPGMYIWSSDKWQKIGPQELVLLGNGAPVNGTTGANRDYEMYFDQIGRDLYINNSVVRSVPEWKLVNREA